MGYYIEVPENKNKNKAQQIKDLYGATTITQPQARRLIENPTDTGVICVGYRNHVEVR